MLQSNKGGAYFRGVTENLGVLLLFWVIAFYLGQWLKPTVLVFDDWAMWKDWTNSHSALGFIFSTSGGKFRPVLNLF